MKRLPILLRLVLGLVFLAACASKLLHPAAFAEVIINYHILPGFLVVPAALILPWLELLCGLALLAGIFAPGAALLTTAMMLVFLGAEFSALWRGLDIACGCFSVDPQARGGLTLSLLRDLGLLALSTAVLLQQWSGQGQRGQSGQ
jgi:uncharacterized membrane protein YphA (DoxX/SURF4 family)